MKRWIAGFLVGCLCLVAGLESFHLHAGAHDRNCAACNLEMQAQGVVFHAPVVLQVRRFLCFVAPRKEERASCARVLALPGRSPPTRA